MDRTYKLEIPKPCTQEWDEMIPDASGRFCNSCTKSVVDFTGMNSGEIKQYFSNNTGKKICGRFSSNQIDSVIVRIPENILYRQNNFRKAFLLALLVTMGTTLFSCSDKDGNRKQIDKVEVTRETEHRMMLGEPAYVQNDSLPQKNQPKRVAVKKTTFIKPIVPVLMGDVEVIPTDSTASTPSIVSPDKYPKTTTSEK
jgi:hypothetical protein